MTEKTPHRLWLEASDAEKHRIVARALQHALARNHLDLPTIAAFLEQGRLGGFGAVVYFDLLERLGPVSYERSIQPDYRFTSAVAGWLRCNPISASPDVRSVIQTEVSRQGLENDRELLKRLRPLYRKQR